MQSPRKIVPLRPETRVVVFVPDEARGRVVRRLKGHGLLLAWFHPEYYSPRTGGGETSSPLRPMDCLRGDRNMRYFRGYDPMSSLIVEHVDDSMNTHRFGDFDSVVVPVTGGVCL